MTTKNRSPKQHKYVDDLKLGPKQATGLGIDIFLVPSNQKEK